MKSLKRVLGVLSGLLLMTMTAVAQTYPEMILVEGGTFTMGDEWMLGDEDEQPTHEVTLRNYKIGKTEVTVAQYRAFCRSTGKSMPETPEWGWQDSHPIVNVSWYDAVAYCDWLSEKQGGLYRLPTEAEWEYAARGGQKSKSYTYAGGNDIWDAGWYEYHIGGHTRSVGRKNANELGIHDMTGNVWEWCADWYDADYYSSSPSTNPRGPSSGSDRVLRGGSWTNSAANCRVVNRGRSNPSYSYSFSGFRVVLSQ